MSVRAYRIIHIKSEASSFNLWHDQKLMQFLDNEAQFSSTLNSEGTGLAEVPVETLQGAVKVSAKLRDRETAQARYCESQVQCRRKYHLLLLLIQCGS